MRRLPFMLCKDTRSQRATAFGLEVPSVVRGVPLLEGGANSSGQGEQNLRMLKESSFAYGDVPVAPRSLDIIRERLTGGRGASASLEGDAPGVPRQDAGTSLENSELDSEDENQVLAEIESLNMGESLAEAEAKEKTWERRTGS